MRLIFLFGPFEDVGFLLPTKATPKAQFSGRNMENSRNQQTRENPCKLASFQKKPRKSMDYATWNP